MRAQIVKINPKTIVIKNEKNNFIAVPRSKFDFEYKLGDIVTIEKNGEEVYFLPNNIPNLQLQSNSWQSSNIPNYDESDDGNSVSLILSIIALFMVILEWLVPGIISFGICCLIAFICTLCSMVFLSDASYDKKTATVVLLAISICGWFIGLIIALVGIF